LYKFKLIKYNIYYIKVNLGQLAYKIKISLVFKRMKVIRVLND